MKIGCLGFMAKVNRRIVKSLLKIRTKKKSQVLRKGKWVMSDDYLYSRY